MTTQAGPQVIRREHTGVIQAITETTQRGQKVWQVVTQPRQGMQYPDNFTCRSDELHQRLPPGKQVTLVLQRENIRVRKDGTTGLADSPWSYYEAIVDVREPSPASAQPPAPSAAPVAAVAPAGGGSRATVEPWHRYIAWAALVAEARAVRHELYGEIPQDGDRDMGAEYQQQLGSAMSIVVAAIRAQMERP